MKRLTMMLLAVLMVLIVALPVTAAETGTIIVKETVKDQEYSAYQMATLDSYDKDKSAYLYTPVEDWKAFFEGYPAYFSVNTEGNLILNDEATIDAAKLAQDALAYAKTNSISLSGKAKTATADGEAVVFDNLTLGYYLVDSSLGALCGLTTTQPTAEVVEKNGKPEVGKLVEEDSDNSWGTRNEADMNQTVNFKATLTVQKGSENLVLHDKMAAGFTYTGISSVTVGGAAVNTANYTVTAAPSDGCTFEVEFKNEYISTLNAGTEIIVAYTAVLNENAIVAGEGNKNETWLDYGTDNNTTPVFTTTTYTYEFDLVKTDVGGSLLDGAEFKLYRGFEGTEPLWFLKDETGYYVVNAGTAGATDTLVVTNGKISVRGLDSDDYALEETKAPVGYNKLTGRKEFTVDSANLSAVMSAADTYVSGGVQVVNKTGSVLPETGALGKTVFIVLGGMLVLTAGVLLISKKRMSKIAE